jgi:hypothetical protein
LPQVFIIFHTRNFLFAAAGCPWTLDALLFIALVWVHDVSCSESCKHPQQKEGKENIQYIKEIKRKGAALCMYDGFLQSLLFVLLL